MKHLVFIFLVGCSVQKPAPIIVVDIEKLPKQTVTEPKWEEPEEKLSAEELAQLREINARLLPNGYTMSVMEYVQKNWRNLP